jgi:microcystin-dependent protein
MSDQFLAEIRMFGCNFAPLGWALADGQLMPISQNTALFSLLGTMFGGDGKSNFALPNLQSRMPVHQGQGAGLSPRTMGDARGTEAMTFQGVAIPSAPASPISASVGYRPQPQTVSPFLVLTFVIALQGIFPARS